MEVFPESFRTELDAFATRLASADPLDPRAPARALRPTTIEGYRLTFRRAASALVRSGTLGAEQITGLPVLFEPQNIKEALRPYLPKPNSSGESVAYKMAIHLKTMASKYVRHDKECRADLQGLVKRLAPEGRGRMGRRNAERLRQFDDPDLVQRLLRFPEEEYARALKRPGAGRRAKGVERALAISILIFTGLRVRNLRTLRLDTNILRQGDSVRLRFSKEEMKARRELELELAPETVALLGCFLKEHRRHLPGAEGPYLFPGAKGGPRSYDAMREAVGVPLQQHAGIELSPHLYRHILARLTAERAPEMLPAVSRQLGHSRFNTTWQSYLGVEGPAASRRLNRFLAETRNNPEIED